MKLVSFFEKTVNAWNEANKCGNCFSFHAPLTEEALNKQQLDPNKQCCVTVLLTRDIGLAFGTESNMDLKSGFASSEWKFKNFVLYFLIPQGIDVNNHTEVLGNSTELSKYRALEDLEECVDDIELDLCSELPKAWFLSKWEARQVINYRDLNYTGYKVSFSIKQRKTKK